MSGKKLKRADLHVHTWHSNDVLPTQDVSPLTLYRKARARGMDYVTFTDHDTMKAYDEIGWTRRHLITGVEVKVCDRLRVGHTVHINVYTLNAGQFSRIREICRRANDLELLVSYLQSEKLPFSYNHPFWAEVGETLNIQSVFDIAPMFPIIEYNQGRVAYLNKQAVGLARKLGKGMIACTDTHSGHIGNAFTEVRAENPADFFAAVMRGEGSLHQVDLTHNFFTWELRHRIQNLFDRSSWAFDKDDFHLDTGIDVLDLLVARLIASPRETRLFLVRQLGKVLDMVALTRLPALLFIKGQQQLGRRIELWLTENAA